MRSLLQKIKLAPKDFLFFLTAVAFIGFTQNIMDSTFNNFLNETFALSNIQRAIIELPRELPGVLVAFVSAVFFFLGSRRLGLFANLLGGIGLILIGFFSTNFSTMLLWLFIYSLGQHIFLPLTSSIGMSLAKEGQTGKRLGEINGAMNAAMIAGSLFVFLGFKYLHFEFKTTFIISAVSLLAAALLLSFMKADKPVPSHLRLKYRKEYRLYYWLSILFGTRKQIFLTFAPWVLVSVFHQKTEIVAALLFIGGIIGIFFKPLLGKAIDKLGERFILSGEAVVLVFVCLGYGFARVIFPEGLALVITAICYILDQLLMAVGMARATYLKKIAVHPDEVAPTLGLATSIDHIFSISIAVAGGLLWQILGYQYVFLAGALIAVVNFFSARRIAIVPVR
jgi:predicted MFS family arabinose efflux permease